MSLPPRDGRSSLYAADVALSATQLAAEKRCFLSKFKLGGPLADNWLSVACWDAMTSASRRAHLYRLGLTQSERDGVREGWAIKLRDLADRYVGDVPEATAQARFEGDLIVLRSYMNEHYAVFFRSTQENGYGPGFRIAHAQKSLSLLLKHYWCNGIMGEPPCCPVDRRILRIAKAGQANEVWTNLDDLDDYRAKLALLRRAAAASLLAPISLAEWELEAFN